MLEIPWRAWHGDKALTLDFPNEWEVELFPMNDAPELSSEDIKHAILSPISSYPLQTIAQGKKTAVIVVDDISRPTPANRILPSVLDELRQAGLKTKNIRVIMSLGAHRPMLRNELILKLGQEVWDNLEIHNHHPYENIQHVGASAQGTQIYISKLYLAADVKIAIGCILPHVYAGFGGGAKLIIPGVAGMETVQANHQPAADGKWGLGIVDGNAVREDMEDIVRRVGLDFSINAVVNSKRQLAGLFAGDVVAAHRVGVDMARQVYATRVDGNLDVGIFNSYPKDTELFQASLALNPYLSHSKDLIREGGIVLITTASPEGGGVHSLEGCHMRMHNYHDLFPDVKRILNNRILAIFSPQLTLQEVRKYYSPSVLFFKEWEKLILYFRQNFKGACRIGIFPCASIQLFNN